MSAIIRNQAWAAPGLTLLRIALAMNWRNC
jgi:hypothetical protein